MIEVFKTNVRQAAHAKMVIHEIHHKFKEFQANFDLEDCDHILRVKSSSVIQSSSLVGLLAGLGFFAEVLPDVPQPLRLDGLSNEPALATK